MKKFISTKTIKYIALIILTGFLFSCHKRTVLEEDYSDYRRVIGPEGGIINFYEYYPYDEVPRVIVQMDFPENAIDSLVVFNMYEYYNEATYVDIYHLGFDEQSKYLYFIPFPESLGYNEYDFGTLVNDTNYFRRHYSVQFNEPVTVTYYVNNYGITDALRLFRIKIPRENEWGPDDNDNVWIKLNQQLYPDGYDDRDLLFLINGRWTEFDAWGWGSLGIGHWEEILDFTINKENRTITFDIDDTDYMYIMGL